MRTVLDWPALIATASNVPVAPAGSEPAQPAGCAAALSQEMVSICGTPSSNSAGGAGAGVQDEESHTTCPFLVTTTCTEPGPNAIRHELVAVETAYTSNRGCAPL